MKPATLSEKRLWDRMPDINIDSSSPASYETILKMPNVSGCEQRKEYTDAHKKSIVRLVLTTLEVDTDKFLNEHALKEEFLMKSLNEISLVCLEVEKNLLFYEQGKTRSCKSVLANDIAKFYELKDNLIKSFKPSLDIEVNSSLGLSLMMKSVVDLQEIYKEIAIKSIAFKSFLTERGLNQTMKRRVGQISSIAHKKFHHTKIEMADWICHNSCEPSWEQAFQNLAKD